MTTSNIENSKTIILTTPQNQGVVSTWAQEHRGVVAVCCTVSINSDEGISATSGASVTTETANEVLGYKLSEWHYDCDYVGSEIEKAFSVAGVIIDPSIYVISGNLCKDIEILNKFTNINIWIMDNDGNHKFLPKS